jgi:hypothetical protein
MDPDVLYSYWTSQARTRLVCRRRTQLRGVVEATATGRVDTGGPECGREEPDQRLSLVTIQTRSGASSPVGSPLPNQTGNLSPRHLQAHKYFHTVVPSQLMIFHLLNNHYYLPREHTNDSHYQRA